MASPECIHAVVGVLAEAFRQKASRVTFAAYEIGLGDLPDKQVEIGAAMAIRECRYMPTVKELRELASGVRDADRPALAWDAVLKVQFNPYWHMDFDDPVVNATIRNLGGWPSFVARFTDAEAEKWARKDFVETYARLLSSGVNGDACRPLPGLSQVQVVGGEKVDPIPKRITTGLPPSEQKPRLKHVPAALIELRKP